MSIDLRRIFYFPWFCCWKCVALDKVRRIQLCSFWLLLHLSIRFVQMKNQDSLFEGVELILTKQELFGKKKMFWLWFWCDYRIHRLLWVFGANNTGLFCFVLLTILLSLTNSGKKNKTKKHIWLGFSILLLPMNF